MEEKLTVSFYGALAVSYKQNNKNIFIVQMVTIALSIKITPCCATVTILLLLNNN